MSDQTPAREDEPVVDEAAAPVGDHLKSKSTWLRFVFMCISAALLWLAGIVGAFVVIVGFLWVLVTGEVNRQLRSVGASLADYAQQIVRYLTYNTDERPFPFGGEWPAGDQADSDLA